MTVELSCSHVFSWSCYVYLIWFDHQAIETAPSDSAPEEPAGPVGPTVDEETLRKLDKDAKELDKANLTLKKEVQQGFNGKSLYKSIVLLFSFYPAFWNISTPS